MHQRRVVDPRKDLGELLWPARFDRAAYELARKELGPDAFAAQFQQRPVPEPVDIRDLPVSPSEEDTLP